MIPRDVPRQGLEWLRSLSDVRLAELESFDDDERRHPELEAELHQRGLARGDLYDEARRRRQVKRASEAADAKAAADKAHARWAAEISKREHLYEPGHRADGRFDKYQPAQIHYDVEAVGDEVWATDCRGKRIVVGDLEAVANCLRDGEGFVPLEEPPPAAVLRRADRRDPDTVRRIDVDERAVWVCQFRYEKPHVLDERGRKIRAREVVATALRLAGEEISF